MTILCKHDEMSHDDDADEMLGLESSDFCISFNYLGRPSLQSTRVSTQSHLDFDQQCLCLSSSQPLGHPHHHLDSHKSQSHLDILNPPFVCKTVFKEAESTEQENLIFTLLCNTVPHSYDHHISNQIIVSFAKASKAMLFNYFYRTQVSLGSGLWVPVSLTTYIQDLC